MSFEYSCDKCPGLKLSSKGQRNKHNSLHKRGFLDPGGDIGVAKKISAGNKVGWSSDREYVLGYRIWEEA